MPLNKADTLGTGADEEIKTLVAAGVELAAGAPSEKEARATAQRTALVSFAKAMSFFESAAGERSANRCRPLNEAQAFYTSWRRRLCRCALQRSVPLG